MGGNGIGTHTSDDETMEALLQTYKLSINWNVVVRHKIDEMFILNRKKCWETPCRGGCSVSPRKCVSRSDIAFSVVRGGFLWICC